MVNQKLPLGVDDAMICWGKMRHQRELAFILIRWLQVPPCDSLIAELCVHVFFSFLILPSNIQDFYIL